MHDNIVQFGGDPNRVMIFRESGGGEEARKMADRMSETWIAFATTGNPDASKSGLPNWDPYETEKRPTTIFDTECRVELDPLKEQRLIFKESPGTL